MSALPPVLEKAEFDQGNTYHDCCRRVDIAQEALAKVRIFTSFDSKVETANLEYIQGDAVTQRYILLGEV
jgi:hypothetical protein